MNSGPVTAGVLRGERARFQLFGDTVNTAARMESTGMRDRIHLSEQTANILIIQGHGSWVKPREEKVEAKGKGILSTYWLVDDDSRRSLWQAPTQTTSTNSSYGMSNSFHADSDSSVSTGVGEGMEVNTNQPQNASEGLRKPNHSNNEESSKGGKPLLGRGGSTLTQAFPKGNNPASAAENVHKMQVRTRWVWNTDPPREWRST